MKMNDYQYKTGATAIYPGQGSLIGLLYVGFGLGEFGEAQGKIKKILRDDDSILTDDRKQQIMDEAGDGLWYLARLCEELGTTLEEVAQMNLDKLAGRLERGTLKGSGDVR